MPDDGGLAPEVGRVDFLACVSFFWFWWMKELTRGERERESEPSREVKERRKKTRRRKKERPERTKKSSRSLTVDHEVPLPDPSGNVAREDLEQRRLSGARRTHASCQPRGAALSRDAPQDRVPAAADGRDVVVEVLFSYSLRKRLNRVRG